MFMMLAITITSPAMCVSIIALCKWIFSFALWEQLNRSKTSAGNYTEQLFRWKILFALRLIKMVPSVKSNETSCVGGRDQHLWRLVT